MKAWHYDLLMKDGWKYDKVFMYLKWLMLTISQASEWVSFLAERCKDIDMLWTSDNLLTCFYDNELRRDEYIPRVSDWRTLSSGFAAAQAVGIISARYINLHLILYLNSRLPSTRPWARAHPHCHCYTSNTVHLCVRCEGILGEPCSHKVQHSQIFRKSNWN